MSDQKPVESTEPGNKADTPTTAMGGRLVWRSVDMVWSCEIEGNGSEAEFD